MSDTRPSASQRGYGSDWRKLRARYLEAHRDCDACGARATEVDHVLAKAQGGTDAWDNLRALCGRCHRLKTNRVDGGFGNPKASDRATAREGGYAIPRTLSGPGRGRLAHIAAKSRPKMSQ